MGSSHSTTAPTKARWNGGPLQGHSGSGVHGPRSGRVVDFSWLDAGKRTKIRPMACKKPSSASCVSPSRSPSPSPAPSPAAKKTAPAAKKTAPAAKKTPAVVSDTPAVVSDTPAVVSETPVSAPAASVAPALVPVPEPVYSLGELARRVPTATPDDVMRYLGHRDRPSLVELGRTVSTERISTDCARIYGQAIDFLATATAEQKAALLGVSERFLGVCVFAAEKGQTANAARQGQAKAAKTSQDTRKNAAVALLASAERTRDQLHAVLEFVIAEDPAFTAVLDAAHSKSSDPAELSGSLTGLVGLAEVVVASKDPDLIARRTDTGLTAALLTTVRALAE